MSGLISFRMPRSQVFEVLALVVVWENVNVYHLK
jgi:hypothetical protein